MTPITITILGNGGCLNQGLPYNAFLLNETLLVEAPPDVMLSLKTLQRDVDLIDTIFISHLHGDHTFGLPFFIINKWLKSLRQPSDSPLTILGPPGIAEYTQRLTEYAFTTSHPCYDWLEQHVRYTIIRPLLDIPVHTLTLSCVELHHIVETYGFCIPYQAITKFAYLADTVWCPAVEEILVRTPEVVLMDMNGGNPEVHTSLPEVMAKGLPITKGATVYYGTHLAAVFDPPVPQIQCARQGLEIVIS
jgi:hypothetical protein